MINDKMTLAFMKLSQAGNIELPDKEKLKDIRKEKEINEVSQQFERYFVRQMLDSMTKNLEGESFLGDNKEYDYFQDLFMEDICRKISQTSNLGIAAKIREQIAREENHKPEEKGLIKFNKDQTKKAIDKVRDKMIKLPSSLTERIALYEPHIKKAAEKYDVDPVLIKAVIAQESYGNPNAVSKVGAKGLMQLMDGTAKQLGVNDSFDAEQNIMGGTKYLKDLINKYGDIEHVLAAYNAGPGAVDKYKGIPPYAETNDFIKRVKNYYKLFGVNNEIA